MPATVRPNSRTPKWTWAFYCAFSHTKAAIAAAAAAAAVGAPIILLVALW